jgi:hypothetical protein
MPRIALARLVFTDTSVPLTVISWDIVGSPHMYGTALDTEFPRKNTVLSLQTMFGAVKIILRSLISSGSSRAAEH